MCGLLKAVDKFRVKFVLTPDINSFTDTIKVNAKTQHNLLKFVVFANKIKKKAITLAL